MEAPTSEETMAAIYKWCFGMTTRYVQPEDPRFDDALQEGRAAAFMASKRHDPKKAPLDFFAKRAAQHRVVRFVGGKVSHLGSETSGNQTIDRGIPFDDTFLTFWRTRTPSLASQIAVEQERALSMAVDETFDERDRAVIYGKARGDTAKEIADDIGMSLAWVNKRWSSVLVHQLRELAAA